MLLLDKNTRIVRHNGRDIQLTGTEFQLLEYLVAHQGEVCRRDDLIDQVWGARFCYDTGTLDVHIAALRRKLGHPKQPLIHTVRGVGYIVHSPGKDHQLTTQQDLHWTRLFSEMLPTTLEEVGLEDLLYEVIGQYHSQLQQAQFGCRLQLTPFVQSVLAERTTLRMIFEQVFEHLLHHTQLPQHPQLTISSSLGMQAFTLTFRCTGQCADWSPLLLAQRLAALMGMPMQMSGQGGKLGIELAVLLKKS
ncbi:MAG: winged helix-turn-helix transcriptional regulator [Paludibacteraceae bacterium]|nr:winged helix-turn-helix transcriptional regulator [Paludibacteraceae bacterium]